MQRINDYLNSIPENYNREEIYKDIASVLATRLINYTINYAENNVINQKVTDRLIRYATDDIFTNDLKYIIIKKIINANKQKFQKLMLNADVVKMAMK
jgi:hypothetical protein